MSPRALLIIRFAIIDLKIGEKIMEATERLRKEELRIESGEAITEVLSEHEVCSKVLPHLLYSTAKIS